MYIYLPFREHAGHGAYWQAVEKALAGFQAQSPQVMARNTQCSYDESQSSFLLTCFGHVLKVTYPEGIVTFNGTGYYPPTSLWIIALNYLWRGDGTSVGQQFIPYRSMPDGRVFDSAFYNMAVKPLIRKYGSSASSLMERASLFGGERVEDSSDICILFRALPMVHIKVRLWEGDDEISPSANILFSDNSSHFLHTEDIAVVGSILSNLLVGDWKVG